MNRGNIFIIVLIAGVLFGCPYKEEFTNTALPKSGDISGKEQNIKALDFEILNWRWDYAIINAIVINGEIKNNTPVAASVDVQAVARDKKGDIIDSDVIIMSNVPPGGTSPLHGLLLPKDLNDVVKISLRVSEVFSQGKRQQFTASPIQEKIVVDPPVPKD